MREKATTLKRQNQSVDLWLLISTLMLVAIGLVAIYDASVISAFRDFSDRFYYFKNQLAWAALGTIALMFFSFLNYHSPA